MKTKFKLLLIPAIFAFLFNSCIYDVWVEGNGDVIEETRTIPDFTQISSSGSYEVYYEYAEEPEVTVSCESNLMVYIETVVYNNELKIRTPYNIAIRPHKTIEVHVKGPYVDEISLSGSGLIHTELVETERLKLSTSGSGRIETTFVGDELETSLSGSGEIYVNAVCNYAEARISGSGRVDVEGEADRALYKISGSGKYYGYDFVVNHLEIDISGSGDMYVNAVETMDISISGSGNIYYIGDPEIDTHISGSGHIYDEN